MARRRPAQVHGLVIVDKPAGITSHDVVSRLRKKLGERRIGHAGTLDPDATGILVVGVGNGTRLMRFLGDLDKEYVVDIVFGVSTDTLDASGRVTQTFNMSPPSIEEGRRVIAESFLGPIMQVPPMVSALKVDGKRLHQLAREGVEVERAPRPVTVTRFDVEPTDNDMVWHARIECGSGTYVRSLAADLGTALGGGAHITNLRRTRVGPFRESDASMLDDPVLRNVIDVVGDMQRIALDDAQIDDVLYGRPFPKWEGSGPWAVVNSVGELVAVYESWRDDLAKPTVVFGGR